MRIRIGIDVGGTFTDAVVMNNDNYEILAKVKVPTTHEAKEGVTKGIIEALHKALEESSCAPEDVVFIAHGTTQATNALLEGDVAKVGVVSMGQGLEGLKAKSDTKIDPIPLTKSKSIISENVYLDLSESNAFDEDLKRGVETLRQLDCESVVAAEAFSVDN